MKLPHADRRNNDEVCLTEIAYACGPLGYMRLNPIMNELSVQIASQMETFPLTITLIYTKLLGHGLP